MDRYQEGMNLIEESCGNGKDNIISLATLGGGGGKGGNYILMLEMWMPIMKREYFML